MKRINRQNNEDGLLYREEVKQHLENLTGRKNELEKYHGPDLKIGSLQVEVKGTKSLYYTTVKRHQIRGWKAHRSNIETNGLTHFAFVLKEKHICSQPLIYVIPISTVKQRANERPNSPWLFFPVWWIFENYEKNLSRVP